MLYIPRSDSGVNALMKWMAIEEEAAQRRQATKQWRVEMARQMGDEKTANKLLGVKHKFLSPGAQYAAEAIGNLKGQVRETGYDSPVQKMLADMDPTKANEIINLSREREGRMMSQEDSQFQDKLVAAGLEKAPGWGEYNSAVRLKDSAEASPAMKMLASLTPQEFGKAQQLLNMRQKYMAQVDREAGNPKAAEREAKIQGMVDQGLSGTTWETYKAAQTKKSEIGAQEQKNRQIQGEISRLERISQKKYLEGTAGEMQDRIISESHDLISSASPAEARKIYNRMRTAYNNVGQGFYRREGQPFPDIGFFLDSRGTGGIGGRPDKYIIEFKDGTTETVFATVPSETSLPRFFDDNRKRLKIVSNKPIKDAYPATGVNASSLQEGRRKDYERFREDEFIAKKEREKVQEEYNSAWGDRGKRKVMQKYPNYYADDSGVIRPRSSTNVAGGDKEDEYDQ